MSILVMVAHSVQLVYQIMGILVNRSELRAWLLLPKTELDRYRMPLKLHWRVVLATNTITLAIFVAMIEVFLAKNGITGVNELATTGQLIPLITALSLLASVMVTVVSSRRDPEQAEG